MLVPHTQIGQGKEAYGFGITSSIDFRRDIGTNRSAYMLTAFPYGENLAFMSSPKLCKLREGAEEGFFLDIKYKGNSLTAKNGIELGIFGEWQGKKTVKTVILNGRPTIKGIGPFSCIASFQMDRQYFDWFDGEISIKVGKNEFKTPVLDATKKNVNIPSTTELVFHAEDFCNLILPNDYKMYVIGWTMKSDFLQNCLKYPGWVWPKDSVDKFRNQPWSQITERDKTSLTRAGFADHIHRRPSSIKAGWLKTNGRGGGACCYVFPNIGRNGGIRETNLYVLPQDLSSFTDLI
ncbi:MAG: hypothetical protein P4L51_15160 [Puia sp.]|nr:hypothetical protein [Puia sp.]